MKFIKSKKTFLAAAKEHHGKRRGLKYLLHQHMAQYHTERSHLVVHASDISPVTKADWDGAEFCAREFALFDILGRKLKDYFLTTSMVMTFGLGRDVQDRVVEQFAAMGRAVGHWRCIACGAGYDFMRRPEGCTRCHGDRFDQVEVRFESAVSDVSCGIDLLVDTGDPKLRLTEIKSMTPDEFRGLKGPLAEHRWRTNLYMRIVAESGHTHAEHINTKEATVLYVSKSGYGAVDPSIKKMGLADGRHSPFKEYAIKRDDGSTQAQVDRATSVKVFRAGGPVPDRICANALCKRAKQCMVSKPCFSGDH